MSKSNEIILHDDYPFKDDVIRAQKYATGKYVKSQEMADGSRQKVTVIVEREYSKIPFVMLYKHKAILESLSAEACKILVHMGITMGYGDQQVTIKRISVGLSKRIFSRAMLELMTNRIIIKVNNKREQYWVNITILVMGIPKRLEDGNKGVHTTDQDSTSRVSGEEDTI